MQMEALLDALPADFQHLQRAALLLGCGY
jgi:hypothetical protein